MRTTVLLLFFSLFSGYGRASDFPAKVSNFSIERDDTGYQFNADIEYTLSPTAKEALNKGIPLTWNVIVKVEQEEAVWDITLHKTEIKYQIQNHALLNLYSVRKNDNETPDMFSSKKAALNAMSKIRIPAIIDQRFIQADRKYHVAVKIVFDREALPAPLRPVSYFDPQWALSSQWILWPLQN